jgi:hypothetical protein
MTPIRLRVATCKELPEPDLDERPLAAALAAGGFAAALVGWDDPAVDWDAPIPTILRSTWNYPLAVDAFRAWIDRVSRAGPLINPRDVVLWNVEKRYLLELDARGVPVVPTAVVERGAARDLATILRADAPPTSGAVLPAGRGIAATFDLSALRTAASIVIKPEVGAASLDARRFAPDDPAAIAHLTELTARGAALVQPYLASVETHGERSVVWIAGELSHAIRKLPRFTDGRECVAGAVAIEPDERAVADAALAPLADRILYGRVDLARDDAGQPRVMELELIEPSLYLTHHPGAIDRFVAALRRFLRAP